MNAVIACGGTGGHLFPGIAVAEVLHERGHEVMLFVSEKEIDALALSTRSQFRFEKLPTIGFPSFYSPAIFGFLRRFNESLARCRSIYQNFKPQAVLGMGGFTSTAPILAGRLRGISTFIHESNAVPGRANRLTARMVRADRDHLGRALAQRLLEHRDPGARGQPQSRRSEADAAEERGRRRAGQPIERVRRRVGRHPPLLRDLPLQVVHLSGTRDERLVADNYQRENLPAFVTCFHHQMEEIYSAADFAIARAGAASLAELALFGLPSILIPFPYATDDHQTRNAEIFVRAGAAVLVKESQIVDDSLAHKIRELIEDRQKLRRMSESAEHLAPKDAANRVVATMEKYTEHAKRA